MRTSPGIRSFRLTYICCSILLNVFCLAAKEGILLLWPLNKQNAMKMVLKRALYLIALEGLFILMGLDHYNHSLKYNPAVFSGTCTGKCIKDTVLKK